MNSDTSKGWAGGGHGYPDTNFYFRWDRKVCMHHQPVTFENPSLCQDRPLTQTGFSQCPLLVTHTSYIWGAIVRCNQSIHYDHFLCSFCSCCGCLGVEGIATSFSVQLWVRECWCKSAAFFRLPSPPFHYLYITVFSIPVATGNNNLQASNLHAEIGK